ncbi:Gfo/Idh/MocA family oxidoreductase [Pontiella agarivorans]|uniref:Gfo/Idh/MocA family oxidoreductase n=1 Tax=Pontiella agarivorans TaxID=3038953 RepID=A0ABU5N0Q7_9BACT|nr:Gfo/Idh/MocA family oxidoreductase [Pontiella agarivorans]MDZ8120027.1 Gfo/Idh/MocA family oxidoreductase [Pontiella agarivorans]
MKNTRRSFVKTSAAASAAIPLFSIGKPGPSANSKVNVAMVGAGGIARVAYSGCQDENIVALCDIDSRQFPKEYAGTPTFSDFRVMYDKMGKEIDAVCINTPDHTHFVATIDAMQRGMHVCTQKPLTHNIWQARTLKKAKNKYGVLTNMGNQGHTSSGIRQMREWYEADVFGQIREIHLGHRGPDWKSRFFAQPTSFPVPGQPVPAGVNWESWIGPAKYTDYNRVFHPATWRGFFDYGTGQFGDFFCHTGDGPVWTLDLYAPTVVECVERGPALEGMIPDYSIIRFYFPARGNKAPCSMYWYDGLLNGGTPIKRPDDWDMGEFDGGCYWFGDKQCAYTDIRSNGPRLASREAFVEFKKNVKIEEKYPRVKGGPHAELMRAIKGDGPEPGSNFDYAGPLTEVALIGVLAQRFGGRIEWDSETMRVTNRPELNAYVKEPVRKGWEYGSDLWKR